MMGWDGMDWNGLGGRQAGRYRVFGSEGREETTGQATLAKVERMSKNDSRRTWAAHYTFRYR